MKTVVIQKDSRTGSSYESELKTKQCKDKWTPTGGNQDPRQKRKRRETSRRSVGRAGRGTRKSEKRWNTGASAVETKAPPYQTKVPYSQTLIPPSRWPSLPKGGKGDVCSFHLSTTWCSFFGKSNLVYIWGTTSPLSQTQGQIRSTATTAHSGHMIQTRPITEIYHPIPKCRDGFEI